MRKRVRLKNNNFLLTYFIHQCQCGFPTSLHTMRNTVAYQAYCVQLLRLNQFENITVHTNEDGRLRLDSAIYVLGIDLQNSVVKLADLSRISRTEQ